MTTWTLRRYPNLLAPLEVSNGNGHREEFALMTDAWDYIGGHMSWNDNVLTEDMTAPPPPDPEHTAQQSARATDPPTSPQAASNRAPGWNTFNMRALRVLFDNRHLEEGMCWQEVLDYALAHDYGNLGDCPWQRVYQLTNPRIYNPTLADQTFHPDGTPIHHGGLHGDNQNCFRINENGMAAYWESRQRAGE